MTPYYSEGGVTIYHGDVLDVLDAAILPKIAGVVSDPPYASGGRQQALARNIIIKSDRDVSEWFYGDNMGSDTYLWWLRQVGSRLGRACAPGAHYYCFTDWRQYPTVVTATESVGWTLRSLVVWDKKDSGMGSFWRNSHELIPVFTLGAPTPLPNGSFFNVIRHSKPAGDEHPTVKPVELVRRFVEATTEGTVVDPFMGSGTTLRAAKDLGREAIGIEISERYCEIAARRLCQEVLDFGGVV